MALKKAKAWWMGGAVRVFAVKKGTTTIDQDKFLKGFKAGSKGMCENMARWAAKNNIEIVNLKRDKKTGKLKVFL